MIKLPDLGEFIAHADSLVNQHGLALLNGIPFDGYSLEFSGGVCSRISKYENGEVRCNYGVEQLEKISPYFDFVNNTVADFDCLESSDAPLFSNCVRLNGKLFTGISIEFRDGILGTITRYDKGDEWDYSSWNVMRKLTSFSLGTFEFEYAYNVGMNGKNSKFSYNCDGSHLSISYLEDIFINGAKIDNACTEIYIRDNPFFSADEFEKYVHLKNIISMKMFLKVPLVPRLALRGSVTKEVMIELMNNSTWNNVREISTKSLILKKNELECLLASYPEIKISYLE
tara:strand:+ start:1001 stop:1855 length:855 start_codon:yes stop_codon:yes gene_type:complete